MAIKRAQEKTTNLQQQLPSSQQTPGANKLPQKSLSTKQKVGYAMRGAKKALKSMGKC